MLQKMQKPRKLAKLTGTRGFLMFPEGQHLHRKLSHISYFAEIPQYLQDECKMKCKMKIKVR